MPAMWIPKRLVEISLINTAAQAGKEFITHCEYEYESRVYAAAGEGLHIYNASAYRSYATQKWVYQRYVRQESAQAADTYSARPGCSEHQTGLALDVNTASFSDGFEETAEYAWLAENAWRFGFLLRFPEGKEELTGYQFEPWHYRYVGLEAAQTCFENGWTLEEYHARQPAPR